VEPPGHRRGGGVGRHGGGGGGGHPVDQEASPPLGVREQLCPKLCLLLDRVPGGLDGVLEIALSCRLHSPAAHTVVYRVQGCGDIESLRDMAMKIINEHDP
jgi:hypothetical protein